MIDQHQHRRRRPSRPNKKIKRSMNRRTTIITSTMTTTITMSRMIQRWKMIWAKKMTISTITPSRWTKFCRRTNRFEKWAFVRKSSSRSKIVIRRSSFNPIVDSIPIVRRSKNVASRTAANAFVTNRRAVSLNFVFLIELSRLSHRIKSKRHLHSIRKMDGVSDEARWQPSRFFAQDIRS